MSNVWRQGARLGVEELALRGGGILCGGGGGVRKRGEGCGAVQVAVDVVRVCAFEDSEEGPVLCGEGGEEGLEVEVGRHGWGWS